MPPEADELPSPDPLMGRIEPDPGPEPSMVEAESLNIPLPKVELLKVAPKAPWPTPPPMLFLLTPRASW